MTDIQEPHAAAGEHATSIWKTWAVVAMLAILFGLIEAAQVRLGSGVLGRPMPFPMAVARVLPYWLLFACLVPLGAVIARRFRKVASILRPTLPHLIFTAVGFALLILVGRMLVPSLDPRGAASVQPTPRQLFQTYFILDVLTYTALVGTLYAFHYYREARNRELMAVRLEASLTETRLKGLEARVEPAFLFKSLETVAQLARNGQQKAVVDTLGRLSELLRAALSDEATEEVALAVEAEALPSEWQYAVQCDADTDAWLALVPRGILAALVEHILMNRAEADATASRIVIGARRRGDLVLELQVTDMSASMPTASAPGLDAAYLHDRLADLYGRAYRLEPTVSSNGRGLLLAIPWRTALEGEVRARPVAVV
jgi:hypothetical protein